MKYVVPALFACSLLAACDPAEDSAGAPPAELIANAVLPPEPDMAGGDNAAPASLPTDAWIGKWVGVEGLALDIGPGAAPGRYRLNVSLLDGANDYEGTADGDVIRFTRDGAGETIRKASGAETGLKWLADKKDCLMIQAGEGFCRD